MSLFLLRNVSFRRNVLLRQKRNIAVHACNTCKFLTFTVLVILLVVFGPQIAAAVLP